ncbi:MAG: hypothetical protein JW801_06725 [Bacteroidales bacterium]|nr:hypothetical protein [Bacteroidales bacterium]
MLITILLILLILIMSFLLFARFRLTVNTEKGLYQADFGRWISVGMVRRKQNLCLRLRVLLVSFYLQPWKKVKKKITEAGQTSKKKRSRSVSIKRMVRLVKALHASLAIKRLRADIDTGDFPLNAQLIPLTYLINGGNRQLNINFEERNKLELIIQTRPATILWKYFTIHN